MAATPDNVLEDRKAPMPAVIAVEHLHKAYGATVAVDDVSFSVRTGEIFGVLGRNGAGKTTTVECLSGLRVPDGGRLDVLGLDPQEDRRELHERVGVQLQQSALTPKIRVGEAVELYASFYRRPADGDRLLGVLGLDDEAGLVFPRPLRGAEAAAVNRPRPHRTARDRHLGRVDDGSRSCRRDARHGV